MAEIFFLAYGIVLYRFNSSKGISYISRIRIIDTICCLGMCAFATEFACVPPMMTKTTIHLYTCSSIIVFIEFKVAFSKSM